MTDEDAWSRDREEFVERAAREGEPDGPALGPLAREFAGLTDALVDATTVAEVLEQVVDAARRVIPNTDFVSVTLRDSDGVYHTPVLTDSVGTQLDELQYRFDEGPCVDAARADGPAVARSADLAVEPAWPRFGPAAARHGARSVLSTALLPPDAEQPGALNIYRRSTGGFTEQDQHVALLLATHASLALRHTRAVELAGLREQHLRRALDSRDVIGQAKGILMHRQGIDAAAAFDILRTTSQRLNVKLAELAATVTSRHRELDP